MTRWSPPSRKAYLHAGGSAGARLRVWELGRDRRSLMREVAVDQPPAFARAAFLHERDDIYHLSYSHGDRRWRSTCVHATSDA